MADLEKQMLERMGYKTTLKLDSIEALATFKNSPTAFDLVVTDMSMPNMTGVQLVQALRSIRPNIPVIVCTGFSEGIHEDSIQKMGFNGLLMKPIVISNLAKTVRNVLDKAEKKINGSLF